MTTAILEVRQLVKSYSAGLFPRKETFRLEADLEFHAPEIVGVMGPNGSGKTTLFELITGSNAPTSGSVLVSGYDIHNVRHRDRDRLAIHHHQSYQVRRFRHVRPSFLMRHAARDCPAVHLFDEPQFNMSDGYIGFMLDFFRRLRADGRLVFVCLHPNEPFHIELMQEVCERFVFVLSGNVRTYRDLPSMLEVPEIRTYLGDLAACVAE